MLIIKRGYKRKYQVGGSGIFSNLKDFFSGFISKKQVVDTALNIARSAGQKAGQKAIDFASSKLTPKSQQILSKLVSSIPPLAPQRATPQKALPQVTKPNLNNLIAGSGQGAIKIQDLINEQIKYVYEKLVALENSIFELKVKIDESIGFTPSCPPTFCNKIAPMRITVAVGGPFESRVLTHCNCC